jgi:hypothetical protein
MSAQILASARRRNIAYVNHFIGIDYLPNVFRREGLWCSRALRDWGDVFHDDPWKWGSPSKAEALSGYVSCSVNPPWGMLKKQDRPVIIRLRVEVLAFPGCLFIGKWSSFGDVQVADALRKTGLESFDAMFLSGTTPQASPHPGEFLVPRHIPLEMLTRVVFHSEEDLQYAREIAGSAAAGQALSALVSPSAFGRKFEEDHGDSV